jgi:hypothetical protein
MKHPPLHKCSLSASGLSLRLGGLSTALFAAAMIMGFAIAGCGGDNSSSTPQHTATPSPTPTPAIDAALWVADEFNVAEFVPSQLAVQDVSTPVPQITFGVTAMGSPSGVTFDAAGNLWVVMRSSETGGGEIVPPSLDEFTPAQLSALSASQHDIPTTVPEPFPNVTIRFTGFTAPAREYSMPGAISGSATLAATRCANIRQSNSRWAA